MKILKSFKDAQVNIIFKVAHFWGKNKPLKQSWEILMKKSSKFSDLFLVVYLVYLNTQIFVQHSKINVRKRRKFIDSDLD